MLFRSDHITLINKSKNILSGRVDDIRRRHGDNIFAVNYRGEADAFAPIVELCEVLESQYDKFSDMTSARIHIKSADSVRSVISAVNNAVELRSFSEVIPSMNNIFIRAVNGNLE